MAHHEPGRGTLTFLRVLAVLLALVLLVIGLALQLELMACPPECSEAGVRGGSLLAAFGPAAVGVLGSVLATRAWDRGDDGAGTMGLALVLMLVVFWVGLSISRNAL